MLHKIFLEIFFVFLVFFSNGFSAHHEVELRDVPRQHVLTLHIRPDGGVSGSTQPGVNPFERPPTNCAQVVCRCVQAGDALMGGPADGLMGRAVGAVPRVKIGNQNERISFLDVQEGDHGSLYAAVCLGSYVTIVAPNVMLHVYPDESLQHEGIMSGLFMSYVVRPGDVHLQFEYVLRVNLVRLHDTWIVHKDS